MKITSVPDAIRHSAWTDFLASVGFDTRGEVKSIVAATEFFGLTVTTQRGDVLRVPFEG